ncbi:hypothetical protein ONQ62_26495, partial [Salmonella enterica subsp. enterica serovar Virginia]|nr:hypothetical protein [Salmonella enterica subsp. enterica serovar Virginia]
ALMASVALDIAPGTPRNAPVSANSPTSSYASRFDAVSCSDAAYQYRLQLASLNKLLNENDALPPLANFKDHSGDAPRTLVLVIG